MDRDDAIGFDASSPRMHLNLTGAAIHEAPAEEGRSQEPAPSIRLPHQDGQYISHIALDIGGSLIKLVYFSTHPTSGVGSGASSGDGGINGSHESSTSNHSNSSSSGGGADAAAIAATADPAAAIAAAAVDANAGRGEGSDAHVNTNNGSNSAGASANSRGGRLHFVKFETQHVEDVIEFIQAKNLHRCVGRNGQTEMRVKATGGGAHKYADIFKDKLGLVLEKEDEMECLVSGCNFLLRAIHDEAFTFESGTANFVASSAMGDVYPYLLVNIGSGVSIIKVDSDSEYQRVSGSSLGGGTFWGLCRLLTRRRDFDEMLQLSARGNNATVDMLVGDIYGGRDYTSIGLSASTIASSFGKVVSQDRELEDYEAGDLAVSLCRMLAYNIAQLAYLNAVRYDLKRVFFGGFFIRGHPYTMETISYAIRFWSGGKMDATFLRHEGFLGAMGAFLKVNPMQPPATRRLQQVRSRFMERFSMGAPFSGGEVQGPPIRDLDEKVGWVEKFVQVGEVVTREARAEHDSAASLLPSSLLTPRPSTPLDEGSNPASPSNLSSQRMHLHVGVLHYTPSMEIFPLLTDPPGYEPNTLAIHEDEGEFHWWLRVLDEQIPTMIEKAVASEGGGEGPKRRAMACARALKAHLLKLRGEPGAYGCLGLAELLEMREDCLREFAFTDAYRLDKERENQAALQVFPDLLAELDGMEPRERLLALVQGVLAANIFDWGARACVALYHEGTILDIYRQARHKLSVRPWRVDSFDAFADRVLSQGICGRRPFRRVMIFVDNAGADIVLGMIPFARQMLLLGCEVVLVANSLPAINDITAPELRSLLHTVADMCPIIRQARQAAIAVKNANNGRVPPFPGLTRIRSLPDLQHGACTPTSLTAKAASTAPCLLASPTDEPQLHAPGHFSQQPVLSCNRISHEAAAEPEAPGTTCSPPPTHPLSKTGQAGPAAADGGPAGPAAASPTTPVPAGPSVGGEQSHQRGPSVGVEQPHQRGPSPGTSSSPADRSHAIPPESPSFSPSPSPAAPPDPAGGNKPGPKLYVVANGQGSPCLDLRRVPGELADACVGVDLLIVEGMGRAIHTNYNTRFKCDSLKLAMIKTERLAQQLFQGQLYDCVCRYEPGPQQ